MLQNCNAFTNEMKRCLNYFLGNKPFNNLKGLYYVIHNNQNFSLLHQSSSVEKNTNIFLFMIIIILVKSSNTVDSCVVLHSTVLS